MPFKFKRQIFGFMDLIRFTKMVPKRREKLAEGSAEKIPASYRVNETARILHPGYQSAKLVKIVPNTADTKTYEFETERPFYFRAGQYMTLGATIDGSVVSGRIAHSGDCGRQRHYAVLQHGASDYRRNYRRKADDILRCEDRGRPNFQNGAGRVEIG